MRINFGFRIPSLKKRIAARRSSLPGGKRFWAHKVGIKAPKGLGLLRNPKKAVYNKVYRRTTLSLLRFFR